MSFVTGGAHRQSVQEHRAMSALSSTVARRALIVAWAVLLAAILLAPSLGLSGDVGDDLTRNTVRLALLFYAPAIALMLCLRPDEWAASGRGQFARCCWSLACLAYLIHVGIAFHYFHHWSHAEAVAHVEARSGFGQGIFVSYLFTLLWALDVLWWWASPARYATRPAWIDRSLHAFMLFVTFNATVVYETGPIRWAGLVMFAALAVVLLVRRRRFGITAASPPANSR
jgi:hypothetical protein